MITATEAEAVGTTPAESGTSLVGGDQATNLVRVTGKALKKLEEIIDMRLPKADKDPKLFIQLVSEQRQAASAIVQTQVRVDENMLRHRSDDTLKKLLDSIELKMAKHGAVIEG